ncbi:MAG: DUF4382 domain-containing protein, partial [Bacteroidota bacterium]|nr:DUF4382 domain-containing protein [Bacteroidota bacterium]
MKKQISSYVKALSVTLIFSAAIVGCQKNTAEPGGTTKAVSVFVTDDPSLVFDNVFVDIQKVEIKAEDKAEAEHERNHGGEVEKDDDNGGISGGWMTLNSKPQVIDILKFRNGLDTLFSTGSFQSNKSISKVRITL